MENVWVKTIIESTSGHEAPAGQYPAEVVSVQ